MLGNKHTHGGAVKTCVVRGAGPRNHPPPPSSSSEEDSVPPAPDVMCEITDLKNGSYDITFQVFTDGCHDVMVTTSQNDLQLLGRLAVTPMTPHGANCRLSEGNSYVATSGVSHTLSLELFDRFRNPAHFHQGSCSITASIGGHALNIHPVLTESGATPLSPNTVMFSFRPLIPGNNLELQISINDSPVPCHAHFCVGQSIETLRFKLASLRAYLRKHHSRGTTPTLTVQRNNLLESAVQVLQTQHFSMVIRVRFDDEIGMDLGGISR